MTLPQTAEHTTKRHRTAMARVNLSRPVRLALEDGLLTPDVSLFDYGCGRGDDIRRLRQQGIECSGWDPNFRPRASRVAAEIVNLGYVINVIEDARERRDVLKEAWDLTRRVLVVSARLRGEQDVSALTPFADGWLTGHSTFQKFYDQDELRAYVEATLGFSSVAAGPGVFYVFRDETDRQAYLAARTRRRPTAVPRRRISDELFEQHKEILAPLMEFFAARGRLPLDSEIDLSGISGALGSVRKAWRIVLWATDETEWDTISRERGEDLLVYLALAGLGGRPALGKLPADLRQDVKAFFGTYKKATSQADELLFSIADSAKINAACEAAPVGKLTQSSLYVHRSALPDLPAVLRVFEGAARTLIGNVEEGNIIKLKRFEPKVSYLSYPNFESHPHPLLVQSIAIELATFAVRYRHFSNSPNPPILHRKDLLVANSHPTHAKFKRLSIQEERAGLLSSPDIGRLHGWQKALEHAGFSLRGHRLLRQQT